MKDYYCLDIEFPDVDFDNYFIKSEEVNKIYHAQLFADNDEIELKIFYDHNTYFGEKLGMWSMKINWKKFGSFIKVSNEKYDDRLQKIDLSEAKLLGFVNSTSFYEGEEKYLTIKVDTVKFYWNPVLENLNTAEFYLFDTGFRVVQDFYSVFFGYDDKFSISRMNGMEGYYSLGKCEFRFEFYTYSKDSRESRTAIITKEPKIQFKFKESINEEEVLHYGDIVSLLASFYYHIKIDYSFRRINLPEYTITIKKVEKKNCFEPSGRLWSFNINWNFHKFLLSNWQKNAIKNFKLLSKTIELFNQALLVDNNSEFLIRYNIIELCDRRKTDNEKFNFVLKRGSKNKKYREALEILLQIISPDEHHLFKNKWNSLSPKLNFKPFKSSLTTFLESQNLNTSEFPISVDELKALRDNITHGSLNKVDAELLRKANKFLYRINGILILNLFGIDDWELDIQLT